MRIEIPKNCPCCNYQLELVNDQLFCRNSACSAQLDAKIQHFCKALGLKGFGAKTIEKLNLSDITELYTLTVEEIAERVNSEKVAEKLFNELERSKSADLAQLIVSFSIPLVGNTASAKLVQVVSSIDDITAETCRKAGLGEKVTNNLLTFLQVEFPEMRQFLPFSFTSEKQTPVSTDAKVVCITGRLASFKTKAEATQALVGAGYRVTETVTKATNYLVDEENKGSTKRTKAESLGIEIIHNLKTFLEEDIND